MALIPPFFLDCVVAIGTKNHDETKNWIGTGFLLGRFFKKKTNSDADANEYHLFLVTNKHVFNNKNAIIIRFNSLSNEPARDYDVALLNPAGIKIWSEHPSEDIAVIYINVSLLKEHNMKFSYFQSDKHVINTKQMSEKGIAEGDFIYVLGYPMSLVAPDRQYVIARTGSIARIRDLLEKRSKDFIVDAFVFPGNSGGPVVSKPEMLKIEGTKSINEAFLIGIVSSYMPYRDVAVSQQTMLPRVIFEENSGLAIVIPVDYIMDTIELSFNKLNIPR